MLPDATLVTITGQALNANAQSMLAGLRERGAAAGLARPHRLAQYLAQLLHESGAFRHDRELWGPTAAQQRYDIRTDLGNTPARDGDGFLFRGRTPMQITGRSNYSQFTLWARQFRADVPDFVLDPDAALTDPWEGLGPIWYWETRNLNTYADQGDIEMVTRRINGGLNGYADRQHWYVRAALGLLGRDPGDIRAFQKAAGVAVDGIAGPRTRAALHGALLRLPALEAPTNGGSFLHLIAAVFSLLGLTKGARA